MTTFSRLVGRLVVAVFVGALTACTSGGGGASETPAPEASGTADSPAVAAPATLVPVIERVVGDAASGLEAGPGDARFKFSGVASTGDTVLVAGERVREDATSPEPALLRSSDGRTWDSVDLGSALPDGGRLVDVVATGGSFVVVAQGPERGEAMALRSADGTSFEATRLPFPEPEGDRSPYAAVATAVSGESVFVLGVNLDIPGGTAVALEDVNASLVLLRSDDSGASWTPAELPPALAEIESSGVFDETPGTGVGGSPLTLVGHGSELILAISLPNPDGGVPTTTLWRSNQGDEWVELATTDELFAGESITLLHSRGESLLAFTSDGQDASAWRSDDGGASFDRLDVDPHILAGGGRQVVDAAVTLGDGTLVAAGRTIGDGNARQQPAELELWVTTDLQQWERAFTDGALAGSGVVQASGVVALNDQVTVVGTHERVATDEEVSEFEDSIGRGVPPPPLARDGAAWVVTLDEQPVASPSAEVARLRITGLDGDVTISDMIAFDGGLVAAGWVGGDDMEAAVWTSRDGESWQRVSSAALIEPTDQRIYALAETDDGLVAVGRTVDDDTRYLGVWTSPDGATWERSDLASPEFESAIAYGAVQTDGGLLVVGEYFRPAEDRFRDAGIWRSADGGVTWSPVDTAGEPFRARDVEVLYDIAALPDGRVIAAGHTGDAERTESGFTYRRHPYVVESVDGQAWTAVPAPYADLDFGEVLAVAVDQGEAVALGWFDETFGDLPDEPRGFARGVARRGASAWSEEPARLRHEPLVDGWAPSPSGLVVTGRWLRGPAGGDPLIGVVEGDSVTFLTDGALLAEGDQHAEAAAPLDDRVVVLGLDTTDEDAPAVIGWSVTLSPRHV